jgi:hypothetical protein
VLEEKLMKAETFLLSFYSVFRFGEIQKRATIKVCSLQKNVLNAKGKCYKTYRLSEKGVQTLVWQNQAKAWTPTKIFI